MRAFIMLTLLLLPCLVFAKDYHYSSVSIYYPGSDNIAMDKTVVRKTGGKITLNGHVLKIDGKVYRLKNSRERNIYKAKGMLFKFVYKGRELDNVQVLRYSQVYSYFIAEDNKKENENMASLP